MLLIHSEAREYRIPLISRLNDKYSMEFVFLKPSRHADQSEVAREWDYRYLWSFGGLGYASNIAPGLFCYLCRRRPGLLILSDCSSFATHTGYLYCRLTRTPYVLFDVQWRWPRALRARVTLPLVRAVIRNAGALVAGGSVSRDFYLRMGAAKDKVFIARNTSLDMEEQRPEKKRLDGLRERLNLSGKTVVLFVGRLKRYKGVDVLLEAYAGLCREIDNVALIIAGDGEEGNSLKEAADRHGLNDVHFTGALPPEEVAACYFVSDFLVHPARFLEEETVNCEAWGLVVNEAMSAGLPVIATSAVGAGYDLIEHRDNGFVIMPDDVETLKNSMKTLCMNKELRRQMGAKSRRKVISQANFDQMAENFSQAVDFAQNRP